MIKKRLHLIASILAQNQSQNQEVRPILKWSVTGLRPLPIESIYSFQTGLPIKEKERTSGQMQTKQKSQDNVSTLLCNNQISLVISDKVENLDTSNPALMINQNPELI